LLFGAGNNPFLNGKEARHYCRASSLFDAIPAIWPSRMVNAGGTNPARKILNPV
jgi:hypothetical protein